jgi:hypothetical protein
VNRRARLARLEKARGVGAWRTRVVEVPDGMGGEEALARLGIASGAGGLVVFVTHYGGEPGLPRLASGTAAPGR